MKSTTTRRLTKTAVHQTLQELLDDYQSQKEESRKDNDSYCVDYWESACETIHEVAMALCISLENTWVDPSWVRSAEYQEYLRKKEQTS